MRALFVLLSFYGFSGCFFNFSINKTGTISCPFVKKKISLATCKKNLTLFVWTSFP